MDMTGPFLNAGEAGAHLAAMPPQYDQELLADHFLIGDKTDNQQGWHKEKHEEVVRKHFDQHPFFNKINSINCTQDRDMCLGMKIL